MSDPQKTLDVIVSASTLGGKNYKALGDAALNRVRVGALIGSIAMQDTL
jgi:hypothetical protein